MQGGALAEEVDSIETEDDEAILDQAKERFRMASDYYSDEYDRAQSDQTFALGEQWPDAVRNQRQLDARPCLTENRLMAFVHQVVNDIRQARPAIKVSPVDDKADVETADVFKGMIRNIEVTSNAEDVYDTAAQNSVTCGYGWLLVRTKYENDQSFDQCIELERVLNPFSVMIDPFHRKKDGSDAEWGFVYDDIPRETFEEEYPDADPVPFESILASDNWCTSDTIRVAEYFYKEYESRELVQLRDGTVSFSDELPVDMQGMVVNRRTVKFPTVKWCKLTGTQVLEETTWPGLYIPIVPVYGEEVWNDGRRRVYSLIHQARDPQMMYNFWLTANTETMAMQPRAPYIGAVGQFKSRVNQWIASNNTNFAFLEYDPVDYNGNLLPAPQRSAPPQGSPAMMNGMLQAADGIKATLGIYDASLGNRSNEQSGKAIEARQREGDNSTFHFIDNLGVAIRQVGLILVDLIPKVYPGPRIQRIIGDDGVEKNVPLNQPFGKNENNQLVALQPGMQPTGIYALDAGRYDVVVEVGPSYATKRQELVSVMLELAKADPRIMQVAPDIFFQNLDIPNSKELTKRVKSLVDPALLSDDPMAEKMQLAMQAVQELQGQLMQMDQELQAKENDTAEKNAIAKQKADTDTAKAQADIEKTKAETAKLLADIATMQNESAQGQMASNDAMIALVNTLSDLESRVNDVGAAVDIILASKEAEAAPPLPPVLPEKQGRKPKKVKE